MEMEQRCEGGFHGDEAFWRQFLTIVNRRERETDNAIDSTSLGCRIKKVGSFYMLQAV
jgi:hypothetical protein